MSYLASKLEGEHFNDENRTSPPPVGGWGTPLGEKNVLQNFSNPQSKAQLLGAPTTKGTRGTFMCECHRSGNQPKSGGRRAGYLTSTAKARCDESDR